MEWASADDIQARLLRMTGQSDAAIPLLRDLITRQTAVRGPASLDVNNSKLELVFALVYANRTDEAAPLVREAIEHFSAMYSAENHAILYARAALATVQTHRKDYAGAAATWAELARVAKTQGPRERERLLGYMGSWGLALRKIGKNVEAEKVFRDAIAHARTYLPESDALLNALRYLHADTLLDLRRPNDAASELQGVTFEIVRPAINFPFGDSWFKYHTGRIALQTGKPKDALAKFDSALQSLRAQKPAGADDDYDDAEKKFLREIRDAEAAIRSAPR